MNKILSALLASLLLLGCGSATTVQEQPSEEPVVTEQTQQEMPDVSTKVDVEAFKNFKILAPGGAPALGLLPLFEAGNPIDVVDGPDNLQAALTGNSDYDLIVAPTNLGVKLASLGKSDYRLLDVLTWGNLYLVGSSIEDLTNPDVKVAAFGEQAVTGLVYSKLYPDLKDRTVWYPSVAEAQAALLSKEVGIAMIAEPAATATIAKGKEMNLDLKVIESLQDAWGDGGYPQAGLFVKQDFYKENKDAVDQLVTYITEFVDEANVDSSVVTSKIEAVGAEKLSVPNAQIVTKTWNNLNLMVSKASDVKEAIASFMGLFGVDSIDGTIIE